MRHLTRTEDEKKTLAQEVVDYLNEVLALDATALHDLIEHRVPCNDALTHHATTQVTEGGVVGLLGILNGLVGARADSWGYVTGVYDDETGRLTRFEVTKDTESPTAPTP